MQQANDTAGTVTLARTVEDIPAEFDDATLARAKRGSFLPRDPSKRAALLEERVRALQRSGLALRDENEQLRVLLAWEAGVLSEAEAAVRLEVDKATLRDYREAALRTSQRSR
jgi:hypothetical protein